MAMLNQQETWKRTHQRTPPSMLGAWSSASTFCQRRCAPSPRQPPIRKASSTPCARRVGEVIDGLCFVLILSDDGKTLLPSAVFDRDPEVLRLAHEARSSRPLLLETRPRAPSGHRDRRAILCPEARSRTATAPDNGPMVRVRADDRTPQSGLAVAPWSTVDRSRISSWLAFARTVRPSTRTIWTWRRTWRATRLSPSPPPAY